MKRTEDPILYSVRRARAKSIADQRRLERIPPVPPPAPVTARRVELAPPPKVTETVEPEIAPDPPKVMTIETSETVDSPPISETIIDAGSGLDWILRRNIK